MDQEERRRRIRELLVPGGAPIGRSGSRANIRVVLGDVETARELLRELEVLGQRETLAGYDGVSIDLGGGDRAGLRERSGSGEPTMDVTIGYVPEVWKIKFEQGDLG